jgi:hypothetical protein
MQDSKGESLMTEIHTEQTSIPLTKEELTKIKVRAIRRGVWFRVLSKIERASMDLTIKVVKRVRSFLLARVLSSIVRKLLDAMESRVVRLMREVGRGLAQKLSRIAQSWGNKSANKWAADPGFIQYLTINCMNTPALFRT